MYKQVNVESLLFCVSFPRYIANFISYFKLLAIALIVTGQNPFQMLGTNTPRVWSWGQENKVSNAALCSASMSAGAMEQPSCLLFCLFFNFF